MGRLADPTSGRHMTLSGVSGHQPYSRTVHHRNRPLLRQHRTHPHPSREGQLLRWLLATSMVLVLAVMITATKLVADINITGPLNITGNSAAAPAHPANGPAAPSVK